MPFKMTKHLALRSVSQSVSQSVSVGGSMLCRQRGQKADIILFYQYAFVGRVGKVIQEDWKVQCCFLVQHIWWTRAHL